MGRKFPRGQLKVSCESQQRVLFERQYIAIKSFKLRSYMIECLLLGHAPKEGRIENELEWVDSGDRAIWQGFLGSSGL